VLDWLGRDVAGADEEAPGCDPARRSALAVPLVWTTPAFAQRSLTVTPSTGLVELDAVTIKGAEFNPSVEVGFCQVADDGTFTHDQRDCGTPFD
jgi:hypothetical protein